MPEPVAPSPAKPKTPHVAVQRLAYTSLPAAAPTFRAAALCSTNIEWRSVGPHLHLPPLAASARFDNRHSGKPARPCTEHGSGNDKRTASDSLYGDLCHAGSRVIQGGRFSAYPSRAGSLETCGFKQRFWSLLGLRPKVTRARERGTFPFRRWKKWGRRRQKPEKSDPRSGARNIPFAAGGINRKIGGAGPRRFTSYFSRMAAKNALSSARLSCPQMPPTN